MMKCEICGRIIDQYDEQYDTDDGIICKECFDEYYTTCKECGEIVARSECFSYADGDYCQECSDELFAYCMDCGEIERIENMTFVESRHGYICENCIVDYEKCEDCEKLYLRDDGYFLPNGTMLCADCFRNQSTYSLCDNCGEVIKTRYAQVADGELLCRECYRQYLIRLENERQREIIHSYHSPKDIKFFGDAKRNTQPFLGIELEIDRGSNDNETARFTRDLMPKDFMFFERDGSLNSFQSYENITQPATFEYHMSLKDKYEAMFENLKQNNYVSHKSGTCGLHIHFNKLFFVNNEEVYISRLLYLVEKYWDNLVKFSRRTEVQLDRWACKYCQPTEEILRQYRDKEIGRYYAVNLSNEDTIEFRLFRGTLNIETFIATIQLVQTLLLTVKNVKNTLELQSVTWDDLLQYDEIKKYWERVKDR